MPLTFEEMADAGFQNQQETPMQSKSFRYGLVLILTLLLGCCAYAVHVKNRESSAARILLSVDGEIPGILPHKKDDSTEFKKSLQFLKNDAEVPLYRPTELAQKSEALYSIPSTENNSPNIRISTIEEPSTAGLLNRELNTSSLIGDEPAEALAKPIELKDELPLNVKIDWEGIVLVPESSKMAKAYNSDVRFERVEAHPIEGEQLRVWARIHNISSKTIQSEVGCEFRAGTDLVESARFIPIHVSPDGVIDAYFVSKTPDIRSYTIMVKR